MSCAQVTAVIDPPGSALLGYFQSGGRTMTAEPGNTILQGVGLARKTRMVEHTTGKVDGGFRANDLECIEMCQYLLRNEGLYVGPTAAANVCGAVKLAKKMGPGHRIATVLCDHGSQYATTAFNPVWLKEKNLVPTSTGTSIDFIKVDKQGALKQASA